MKQLINKFITILITIIIISAAFAMAEETAKAEKTRLAIMDFQSIGQGIDDGSLGRAVAENLRTELIQTGKFVVIERASLIKVFEEQQFQFTGAIDQQTAVKVGKIAGAQKLVMGSLTKFGNTFTVNVRFIDVETGIATKAEKLRCDKEDDIPILIEGIVKLIMGEKWSHPVTVRQTQQEQYQPQTAAATAQTPVASTPRGKSKTHLGFRMANEFNAKQADLEAVPGLDHGHLYGESALIGGYFLFTAPDSVGAFEIGVDHLYKTREIEGLDANGYKFSSYTEAEAKFSYTLISMSLLIRGQGFFAPYFGGGVGMGFWREVETFQINPTSTVYKYIFTANPIPTISYRGGLDLVLGESFSLGAGYKYIRSVPIKEIDQTLNGDELDEVEGEFTVIGSMIEFHAAIHF